MNGINDMVITNTSGVSVLKCWLSLIAVMFLAACQASADHSTVDLDVMDEIQQVLADSGAVNMGGQLDNGRPPDDILQSLVPGLSLSDSVQEEVEDRFDLQVRDPRSIRDFIGELTDGTDYSVLIHPRVTGNVDSLVLKNVTVEEVLEVVSTTYGWGIEKEGDIYRVMPGGVQTKIFKINYLNVIRTGSSNMSVSGGNSLGGDTGTGTGVAGATGVAGTTGGVATGVAGVAGQAGTQGTGTTGTGSAGGAGSNVSTSTDSDFWDELEETVKAILGVDDAGGVFGGLSGSGQRKVVVSPQSGTVVVTAMPEELAKVEEYLKVVQTSAQRQVVLEAKILEVELKEAFQSGIDLSLLGKVNTNNTLSADFSFLENAISSNSSPLNVSFGSTDFNAVISLLESQGNVQVISSPRLTTLHNQKAVFKVGDEQYFLTGANSTSFGAGDQQTTNQNNNLEPFFSGIALDVTPSISENGDIYLHIHPLLNQVKEDMKQVGGEQLPLASSVTRETDSMAIIRSGEVVVLSGLMQTRSVGAEAGIPGARDVPVVGRAFEQRQTSIIKTELVILIRAIVDEDDNMRQMIQETNDNVERLRKRIDPFYR